MFKFLFYLKWLHLKFEIGGTTLVKAIIDLLLYIPRNVLKRKLQVDYVKDDYCYYLSPETSKVEVVRILWADIYEDYDSFANPVGQKLLGYYIVGLNKEVNALVFGKLIQPSQLIKIRDPRTLELIKALYG